MVSDHATATTEGLPFCPWINAAAVETCGRRNVTVRRPCHNGAAIGDLAASKKQGRRGPLQAYDGPRQCYPRGRRGDRGGRCFSYRSTPSNSSHLHTFHFLRRHATSPSPARPNAARTSVLGSGTAASSKVTEIVGCPPQSTVPGLIVSLRIIM